jgi:hypothetical protein
MRVNNMIQVRPLRDEPAFTPTQWTKLMGCVTQHSTTYPFFHNHPIFQENRVDVNLHAAMRRLIIK